MTFERKLDGANIVVVGDLNPRIFQPEWFRRQELLRDSEVDAAVEAENFVLTEQLTNFEVDWLVIQATRNRLVARAKEPSKFRLLDDLMAGILRLLEHTPVRLLGLNRTLHYQMDSPENWHAVGDALVPKVIWDDILGEVGMRGVQIEAKPRNEMAEHFHLKVQPSKQVVPHGVYFDFNEQYNTGLLSDQIEEADSAAMFFSELIQTESEDARRHTGNIADNLLERIVGEKQ